jgi:hypothetical protein
MYDAVHLFARALDELDRSQVKQLSIIKANIATVKSKRRGRTGLSKCRRNENLINKTP